MTILERMVIVAAVLTSLGCDCYACQVSEMRVEPKLLGTRYCRDTLGTRYLDLNIELSYRNTSQKAILFSKLYQLSGYAVFVGEESLAANRPDRLVRYKLRRLLDISKSDLTKPEERLFDLIEPAGIRLRQLSVQVPLDSSRRTETGLLGKDVYLRVETNQWLEGRRNGVALRKRWGEFGFLWIDNVLSEPLKVHIDSRPAVQQCLVGID